MTRDEMVKKFDEWFVQCREKIISKNADYGADKDPFRNLRMVEKFEITSASVGILTRISDKFSRLINFFVYGNILKVKDEKIEDTAQDLCNYIFFLTQEYFDRKQNKVAKETDLDREIKND